MLEIEHSTAHDPVEAHENHVEVWNSNSDLQSKNLIPHRPSCFDSTTVSKCMHDTMIRVNIRKICGPHQLPFLEATLKCFSFFFIHPYLFFPHSSVNKPFQKKSQQPLS